MIYNFKNLVDDTVWKTNTKNEIIPWSKIREIYTDGNEPGVLKYKINFKDSFSKLNTGLEKTIHPLENAYNSKFGITQQKKKDLMSLCKRPKAVIPEKYHKFYQELTTQTEIDNTNILQKTDIEFEEEENPDEEKIIKKNLKIIKSKSPTKKNKKEISVKNQQNKTKSAAEKKHSVQKEFKHSKQKNQETKGGHKRKANILKDLNTNTISKKKVKIIKILLKKIPSININNIFFFL